MPYYLQVSIALQKTDIPITQKSNHFCRIQYFLPNIDLVQPGRICVLCLFTSHLMCDTPQPVSGLWVRFPCTDFVCLLHCANICVGLYVCLEFSIVWWLNEVLGCSNVVGTYALTSSKYLNSVLVMYCKLCTRLCWHDVVCLARIRSRSTCNIVM